MRRSRDARRTFEKNGRRRVGVQPQFKEPAVPQVRLILEVQGVHAVKGWLEIDREGTAVFVEDGGHVPTTADLRPRRASRAFMPTRERER